MLHIITPYGGLKFGYPKSSKLRTILVLKAMGFGDPPFEPKERWRMGPKVQALATAAADPDAADRDGGTPLRAAVAAGGSNDKIIPFPV